ncbi:hypothetical protein [Clostridium sp. C8-1-8]|nr:hypothetical protein [Clostridium sp. C8-1-8]
MYTDYLNGKGSNSIAWELEEDKIPKWDGHINGMKVP